KLLDEAQGPAELEKLNSVFSTYFATTIGAAAADRLGDLLFQRGDFDRAAQCWQAVLKYHPEYEVPRVRLLVKSGIALARARRWDEFDEIQRNVASRHPGEKVVLGGHDVDAGEHLRALAAADRKGTTEQKFELDTAALDFALPASNEPSWQFRFFNTPTAKM